MNSESTKKCSKCLLIYSSYLFPKDRQKVDGIYPACKECCRKRNRRYACSHTTLIKEKYKDIYKTPKEKERLRNLAEIMRKKYPEKMMARRQVFLALSRGSITKEICECCSDSKVHAHHEDYSKPLEVRWLCGKHHRELHRKSNA